MKKQHLQDLLGAVGTLENKSEIEKFFKDLLTPAELEEFATRFQIAKLLWTTKMSYAVIAEKLHTSTTTVTRVARFLNKEPHQGYQLVLKRLFPKTNA